MTDSTDPFAISVSVAVVVACATLIACLPLFVAGLRARRERATLVDDTHLLATLEPSTPGHAAMAGALARRTERSLARSQRTERRRDAVSSLRWAWVCAVTAGAAGLLTADVFLKPYDVQGLAQMVVPVFLLATAFNLVAAVLRLIRSRRSEAELPAQAAN